MYLNVQTALLRSVLWFRATNDSEKIAARFPETFVTTYRIKQPQTPEDGRYGVHDPEDLRLILVNSLFTFAGLRRKWESITKMDLEENRREGAGLIELA